jgi:hypothetical protein
MFVKLNSPLMSKMTVQQALVSLQSNKN